MDSDSYGTVATVVAFLESSKNNPELIRIKELLADSDVIKVVSLSKAADVGTQLESDAFEGYLNCQFFYKDLKLKIEETEDVDVELPLFLVDGDRVIRGLYIGEDKIDVDRLITEVEIMKKYNGEL